MKFRQNIILSILSVTYTLRMSSANKLASNELHIRWDFKTVGLTNRSLAKMHAEGLSKISTYITKKTKRSTFVF